MSGTNRNMSGRRPGRAGQADKRKQVEIRKTDAGRAGMNRRAV
jgi:hypothetical protein